ncbi:DUF5996 family protein [Phenylobacterium sp.]|jgi:hypothetical protein|uniref:DUF5996 family protein n=1 Tax=Phenylobacterium sp. TaxID=1871053 RepID=UPI002F4066A4
MAENPWPELVYAELQDTCATLQLWMQVVGKVRLALAPWLNHSWHVPLYVTARGLGTGPVPCGAFALDMEFDFVAGALSLRRADGGARAVALRPMSVAEFYGAVMEGLAGLGVDVKIGGTPNEMAEAVPFAKDHAPRVYDAAQARRFWLALSQAWRVLSAFRTGFLGKASPAHVFWGGFDLAATRFSGRPAPPHPGGVPHLRDAVTREAYSHEVSSAGFWPGGGAVDYPAFYAYAYPEPTGFRTAKVAPAAAFYHDGLREFVLPYAAVQGAADPDAVLLAFLQSTYEAAADLGRWDRAALECDLGKPGIPRVV